MACFVAGSHGRAQTLDGVEDALRIDPDGPLRHMLLDESTVRIGAVRARTETGATGRSVVIALMDTGIDLRHGDFRETDGRTRVAWMLDLTQPARGAHVDLESRFGIERDGVQYGAVYAAADVDALLTSETTTGVRNANLPVDPVGHGTYVASIAAGNGRAFAVDGRFPYTGVAPEAALVVVRASVPGTTMFSDAAIVAGVAFALDRARAMGMPVVVNVSAGSHHGAHDGSSALELALASLVPGDRPGEAIVVAAGNDGSVPIHARATSDGSTPVEFPVALAPAVAEDRVTINIVYGGVASVAVRFPSGVVSPSVQWRERRGFTFDDATVGIANAVGTSDADPAAGASGQTRIAEVVFGSNVGTVRPVGTYTLLVRARGSIDAYIADSGRATPRAQFTGDGEIGSAVVVPATSSHVIAVGASVTRLDGPSESGSRTHYPSELRWADESTDVVAWFSSPGPDRLGRPRPDFVAPGAFVIAALSAEARPGSAMTVFPRSQFVAPGGRHVASSGTSAAAPHVTGAIALLFALDPSLTQNTARALLASTARPVGRSRDLWSQRAGYGEIAIDVAVAELRHGPRGVALDRVATQLAATVPSAFADQGFTALVRLRDLRGDLDDAPHDVRVSLDDAEPARAAALGHGLYRADLRTAAMRSSSAIWRVRARVDGEPTGSPLEIPWRGRNDARFGSGGCSVATRRDAPSRAASGAVELLLAFCLAASRRTRPANRVDESAIG